MEKRKSYREKMETQLKDWCARIDRLKTTASSATAENKLKLEREIEVLRKKKDSFRIKLEGMKDAGEDAWEVLKSGLEKAAADLKDAFDEARSKFKEGH
jgi:hypothetical protein